MSMTEQLAGLPEASFHTVENISTGSSGASGAFGSNGHTADSCAILLFTSGSTGHSKAIEFTHRQLITSVRAKAETHKLDSSSTFMSWISFDHSANFCELHLNAMNVGANQYLVPASDLVHQPHKFFELLGKYRIAYTFSPNSFLAAAQVVPSAAMGTLLTLVRYFFSQVAQPATQRRLSSPIANSSPPSEPKQRPTSSIPPVPSSSDLVHQPHKFFELLGKYRIAYTFSPNSFLAAASKAWEQREDSTTAYDFSNLKVVMVGGEANKVATLQHADQILAAGGAAPYALKAAYGLSETCSACFYNLETPSWDLEQGNLFATVGKPLSLGLELRLVDDDLQPVKDDQDGKIQLRGEIIFPRYFNNEKATSGCMTSDGWFDTGDLGRLDKRGNLAIVGRSKEILILGGNNYSSFELEHAIESRKLPGVSVSWTASFSVWDHKKDTESVVVIFNPPDEVANDQEQLRATISAINESVLKFCSTSPVDVLPLPKEEMPKSTIGKLSRQKLKKFYEAGQFDKYRVDMGDDGANAQPTIPLSTEMQHTVARLLTQQLGLSMEQIGADSKLSHLNMSSLTYLRLKRSLEMAVNRADDPIRMGPFLEARTVADLATLAETRSASQYQPLVTLRAEGSKPPLFLFPPGGGEFIIWLSLLKFLPDRPVYALQIKGLEANSNGTFDNMPEMLDAYESAILEARPSGPYALLGLCFGGMTAFEIGKRLESRGHTLSFCGGLDTPPELRNLTSIGRDSDNIKTFLIEMLAFYKVIDDEEIGTYMDKYAGIPEEEAIDVISEDFKDKGLQETGLVGEKIKSWHRVFGAAYKMANEYIPSGSVRSYECFWAQPYSTWGVDLAGWEKIIKTWGPYTREGCEYRFVPGHHFSLLHDENVGGLAKSLVEALDDEESKVGTDPDNKLHAAMMANLEIDSKLNEQKETTRSIDASAKAFQWSYKVPEWFITNNVKSRHELAAIDSKLILVNEENAGTTGIVKASAELDHGFQVNGTSLVNNVNIEKDAIENGNHDSGMGGQSVARGTLSTEPEQKETYTEGTASEEPWKVSAEVFEELCDAAGSALVIGSDGRLVAGPASIMLCTDSTSGLGIIDSVIAHLAKEMSASVISMEVADLEDIGSDFLAHEKDLNAQREMSKQELKDEKADEAKTDKDVQGKDNDDSGKAKVHSDIEINEVNYKRKAPVEEEAESRDEKEGSSGKEDEKVMIADGAEEENNGIDNPQSEIDNNADRSTQDQKRKTGLNAEKEKEEQDGKTFDEHSKEREQYDFGLSFDFAGFYFGVQSKKSVTEPAIQRNNKAFTALLDGAIEKEDKYLYLAEQPTRYQGVDAIQPPIFIHMRDVTQFMTRGPPRSWSWKTTAAGTRIVARIRGFVQAQRMLHRKIVLFFSVLSDVKPYGCDDCTHVICTSETCGATLRQKLRLEDSSIIGLQHLGDPADNASGKQFRYKYDNIRRLKQSLRAKRLANISPELLAPDTVWEDLNDDPNLRILETSLWSIDEVQHAVSRISGRSFRKAKMELSDILEVLRSLQRSRKPTKTLFEERLEDVRKSCNELEKQFLPNVIDPQKMGSSYDKVVLDDNMKATVKQLVSLTALPAEITSHHLIKNLGTNGALFYGPPGTGKTFLAQAIAKDSGATMLAIDGASVTNCWVGETEKRIKATFTLAIRLHPCILFIDEVDSLFYRRGSDDKTWQRAALTQYLQMMDGLVNNKKKPFVIVATNRPSDLDEAFLRRLSHRVHFDLPSMENRVGILRNLLEDEDIDSSVILDDLAKATEGFSGSDLRNLCSEATLVWLTEVGSAFGTATGHSTRPKVLLNAHHFAQALERTHSSVSKRSLTLIASFKRRFDKTSKVSATHFTTIWVRLILRRKRNL
nr:nonribosomal peptide synthetase pnga [Quercus suber]